MPLPGVDAKNYILFGHSLHSTLQASTCLYEAMPSYSTLYPGAPFSPHNESGPIIPVLSISMQIQATTLVIEKMIANIVDII